MKVILPEYCTTCGERLEGNFICEYCGEEVIYPKQYVEKINKEYEKTKKKKNFLLFAGGIVIFLVISFSTKIYSKKRLPQSETLMITKEPTKGPVKEPTKEPAKEPTKEPAKEPTKEPAKEPTKEPAKEPTKEPAKEPAKEPTKEPAKEPTKEPVKEPAKEPTKEPVKEPAKEPTKEPTKEPVKEPTYAKELSIPKNISIKLGNSMNVPITYTPTNAKIIITSGCNEIISISGKIMKAVGKGSCNITVSSGNKSVTCRVIVVQ